MSTGRHAAGTAGRLVLAAFCWITALYAFVASSAFAYLQFIKPRVFEWIGQISDWHATASIAWLALLVLVVRRDLTDDPSEDPSRRLAGWLARGGLVLAATACLWNLLRPVLPRLTDGTRTLTIGVLVLTPTMWLAAVDQMRAAAYLRRQRSPEDDTEFHAFEGRLLAASIATSVLLSVFYAVLAAARLAPRFEPDLLASRQAIAFGVSLVYHLAIAIPLFLAVALIVRLTRRRFRLQYAVISGFFIALLAVAFARIVSDALGLHGASGWLAASATAVSIVGTWTSVRLRALSASRTPLDSAVDLYLGVSRLDRSSSTGRHPIDAASCAWFGLAGLFAYAAIRVSGRLDWDFALLDSGVVAVWLALLALVYQRTPFYRARAGWLVALLCLGPLVGDVAVSSRDSMRSTLDRYAVYNPSFRLAESLLGAQGPSISSFDRYLRVNTGLTDVTIAPIDIELVPNLGAASVPPPPIFLFVIDSLRPDYLAPYNPAVRFTPRIAEFAAESVVFTNALTRYGGTGLSVPAIWAGSAIIHKQYVKPFHAMNTLEKLLDANRYRRIVGLDSIMGQLLQPSSDIDELDRGRQVMDYQFCRTLDELQSKLSSVPASSPVFAYSLPQDIHMSRLPRSIESGDEYRSFYAPYATKVHALDGCFGRFIDALKARRIYDDSLIVLTADHGEMLGEDGRFGHSYHLFPQTVQVPLIVHLPASVARRAAIDTDAVSLTTDITPTMYAALGYRPVAANDLTGRSLIDADDQHSTARRRDSFVIAASYGSVYAVARHNARRLYVADAVRGGDQAFERDASGQWHVVPVTSGLRAIAQFAIRHQIDELARMYHVDRN